MNYHLGVDIGSVNAKLSLIDENGTVTSLDIERITSGPKAAVNSLISRLASRFSLDRIATAGVSGSGKGVIPREMSWMECGSTLAIASGLLNTHPDTKTIIQIGGQSSLVIDLEDGLR
ncbi:hypothetical protein ACFLTL_01310, partial [Chloroflexota bacterium]